MNRSARRALLGLACAFALAGLGACATPTQLLGEWKNPAPDTRKIGSVLAVAAIVDATSRQAVENGMVSALAARGIKAQPSYPLLPDRGPGTETDAGRVIAASGVDSVLLMTPGRLTADVDLAQPGSVTNPFVPIYVHYGFYGYYSSVWAKTRPTPAAFGLESMTSEARLFNARSNTVEWAGTLQTDLSSRADLDTLARQYGSLVVDALAKAGLLR